MANRKADIPATFESGWLGQLDGRMNLAKNLRDRYSELCSDLGGQAQLSYAQRSLVERALWLEYWLSTQEQQLAKGGEFDSARWTQGCNALLGVLKNLGLERRQRDVPDLQTYLRSREAAA